MTFYPVGSLIKCCSGTSFGFSIVSVSSLSVNVALGYSDNSICFPIIASINIPSLETLSIDCSFNSIDLNF